MRRHPGEKAEIKPLLAAVSSNAPTQTLGKRRDFVVHHGALQLKSHGRIGTTEGATIKVVVPFAVYPTETSDEAYERYKTLCKTNKVLCGFGPEEIADAFLTNKEVIYKRLNRAKEKLRMEKVRIAQPSLAEINDRVPTVLTTLYLLFNEGYYSASQKTTLQKELCIEAMRLVLLLIKNRLTNKPQVNALLSLMCFHSSRFEARTNEQGEMILYHDQNAMLWNKDLIARGEHYLNMASQGDQLTKYHVEAAIAYWHTHQEDTAEKWESILQLYNKLLQLEYSPMAALNRTYALAKANGKAEAIIEAEKLKLSDNHLYHSLLGNLYTNVDDTKALLHFNKALKLARSQADKSAITKNIQALTLPEK